MDEQRAGDVVVLTNPQSSGPYLAQAFHEAGVRTVHLYDAFLAEYMRRDTIDSQKILHHSMDETLRALERLRPLAIIPGAENGVPLADELTARMGFPHNVPELSLARRDKFLMLDAVAKAGLPAPLCFLVHDEDELIEQLSEFPGFPVVVKPRNSAGGDGIRICRTPEEAVAAFQAIDGRTNVLGLTNVGAILQEYLEGDQFGVSTVSIGGRHLVAEFLEEGITVRPGRSVERDHLFRSWLGNVDREIVHYVLGCLDALGVREGPAFTEVRLTSQGPQLLEVNCRLGGPILDPDPYWVARGYSLQHLVVERHLQPALFRNRLDTPQQPHQALGYAYLQPPKAGTICQLRNVAALRALPAFHSVYRLPKSGMQISDPYAPTANTCTAYFIDPDVSVVRESLNAAHALEANGMFVVDDDDRVSSG